MRERISERQAEFEASAQPVFAQARARGAGGDPQGFTMAASGRHVGASSPGRRGVFLLATRRTEQRRLSDFLTGDKHERARARAPQSFLNFPRQWCRPARASACRKFDLTGCACSALQSELERSLHRCNELRFRAAARVSTRRSARRRARAGYGRVAWAGSVIDHPGRTKQAPAER